MKPTRPPLPPLRPLYREEGEELAQFVLQNMSVPEVNAFLSLLARDRGASYTAKSNPGPDVFTTIRRHLRPRTSRLYLAELRRRKGSGEPLVQRSISS